MPQSTDSKPVEHNSARAIAPEGRAFANGESIAQSAADAAELCAIGRIQQRDSKTRDPKPFTPLKHYDADTGLIDGAVAPEGFERSRFELPAKRNATVIGIALLAIAIVLGFLFSYHLLFLVYSIYATFVFMVYLVLWLDNASQKSDEPQIQIEAGKWPSVTIIIPSFNSGHTIFKCIDSCKALEYAGALEILVVDDGSTDGSYERIRQIPGITVIRKEKNEGKAAALNCGILQAKGEIIGCVDSDTYPSKDALVHAVKYFIGDEKVGAVVLFINTTQPRTFIQEVQELEYWISFGFFFKTISSVDGLYVTPGPMALYRRKLFDELGGFDEQNLTEDMEIALRMQRHGWKIRACHSSVVYTEVPATLGALYKQRLRWFRGGVMNMLKYLDMFLNPKYNDFGFFVLPVTMGSGFFAALFTLWTSWILVQGFWNSLPWLVQLVAGFATGLAAGATGGAAPVSAQVPLAFDPLLFDPVFVLALASMAIWAYFVLKSFDISRTRSQPKHVRPLLAMVYLYPIFVGLTFLSAYFHEFSGRRYKW